MPLQQFCDQCSIDSMDVLQLMLHPLLYNLWATCRISKGLDKVHSVKRKSGGTENLRETTCAHDLTPSYSPALRLLSAMIVF